MNVSTAKSSSRHLKLIISLTTASQNIGFSNRNKLCILPVNPKEGYSKEKFEEWKYFQYCKTKVCRTTVEDLEDVNMTDAINWFKTD